VLSEPGGQKRNGAFARRPAAGRRERLWIVGNGLGFGLDKATVACVFMEVGRAPARGERRMPLARAAKRMKRLKTAMGSYWKKLAWIWLWRHVGLGLAPRRLGVAPRRLGARATRIWRWSEESRSWRRVHRPARRWRRSLAQRSEAPAGRYRQGSLRSRRKSPPNVSTQPACKSARPLRGRAWRRPLAFRRINKTPGAQRRSRAARAAPARQAAFRRAISARNSGTSRAIAAATVGRARMRSR